MLLSKSEKFLQDQQFLDAFLSSCIGILSFNQMYAGIVDADTKLKASDIQVKLLESIRLTISDQSIKQNLQASLTNYLLTFNSTLQQTTEQLKRFQSKLIWMDPEFGWKPALGDLLTPIKDVIDLSTKIIIFRRGTLYNVVDINNSAVKGFYLINDYGRRWYLHFGKNGGADLFAFYDPPLPSMGKEKAPWELFCKIYDDDFLLRDLKSVRSDILVVFNKALEQSQTSKEQLVEGYTQYKLLRYNIAKNALQSFKIRPKVKPVSAFVIIGIFIVAMGFIIFMLMYSVKW